MLKEKDLLNKLLELYAKQENIKLKVKIKKKEEKNEKNL